MGVLWAGELEVEPLFDLRYIRSSTPKSVYEATISGGLLLLSREVSFSSDAEGNDVSAASESLVETLWAACAVDGAEMESRLPGQPWRPMWYSLDAARRRYLRRLAAREVQVIEHAPMWELAAEWVYSPVAIHVRGRARVALGFAFSEDEAAAIARTALTDHERLLEEKQQRLSQLLRAAWFSCGHAPTDLAYSHVLSRVTDCLIVSGHQEDPAASSLPVGPAVLAGNAYFQEAWKRDENIALGGLLATAQYDLARHIIDSTWQRQDEVTGRLPLRSRPGESPGYTSSDGTLWALVRLAQYVRATDDTDALAPKMPLVALFFRRSLSHVWQGLLPSGGVAIPGHDWETWMDTEFSARAGYPVEIQLLWLACLREYASIVGLREPELQSAMTDAAAAVEASLSRFLHGDYFADHLTPRLEPVYLLTPNSYFWTILGIDFDWAWEQQSLALGRHELAGVSGVRTLARSQWESVLGPQVSALARRGRPLPSVGKANYHRGVEWNWLAQLFVAGELRHARPDMAFDHYLARQIHDAGTFAGLGGISEVFDHRGPAGPDFQTWSMTGLLESLHRFTGVTVDAPAKTIQIRPQKPRRWPFIRARYSMGGRGFLVEYTLSKTEREVTITFEEEVDVEVQIDVEFVLKASQRAGRVRVDTVTHQNVAPSSREEQNPRRIIVRLTAERQQRIRLTI